MRVSFDAKNEAPAKKTFRLGDTSQTQLNAIMEEYGIKTENEAIKYVLEQHMRMATAIRLLNRNLSIAEDTIERQRFYVGQFMDAQAGMFDYFNGTKKDEEE